MEGAELAFATNSSAVVAAVGLYVLAIKCFSLLGGRSTSLLLVRFLALLQVIG